ncbi:MAG TPA: hypothetical protein VG496_10725 [Myxococcales bacterium]|nr:hypothetical protein [Myxococcales bacterium]
MIALLLAALTIASEPPRVQLGETAKTRLRIRAASEPRLSVSVGSIAKLRSDGTGEWIAEYLPPDDTIPQLAVVSAIAGDEVAFLALPLWGQGDAVVKTRPRARIEVQIGGEKYPAIADDSGTAVVPVNVPPGVSAARHGSQEIDLHVPPLRLVHVMVDRDSARADRDETVRLLLFAIRPDGSPREGARFVVRSGRGQIAQPSPLAPGIYQATWTLPAGTVERVSLSVVLEESPALSAQAAIAREAGPVASLELTADRARIVAGEREVAVRAVALDATGNISTEPLHFETSVGEVRGSGAEVRVEVPSSFDGHGELRLTAHPASRPQPSAELVLPLVPAEARVAKIDVLPKDVHADGTTAFPVRLRILDQYGNAIPDAKLEVTADGGSVALPARYESGAYVATFNPPLAYERSTATIAVRSGAAEARARIDLLPDVHRLALTPRIGLLTNFSGFTSPLASFEASLRTNRFGPELAFSAELSYALQNTGGSSPDGITARVHTDWITMSLGAAWRTPLGAQFHGWIGAGPQITTIVARTQLAGMPAQTNVATVPGGYLAIGAERRMRSFLPFAEARMSVSADPSLSNLHGALHAYALSLGCRFEML